MPEKDKYFNFYHWYILMKQFAPSAIDKWIKNDYTLENDKLVAEILPLIESHKLPDLYAEYVMNIIVKAPIENNITAIKNKLLTIEPKQLGDELKLHFKNYQQRVKEYSDTCDQLRIMFRLRPA